MRKRNFNRLYEDLKIRVKEENKTDASWLMGFMQGLGNRVLTGYQFAALVDLLLVQPNKPKEEALTSSNNNNQGSQGKQEEQKSSSSPASVGRINFRP